MITGYVNFRDLPIIGLVIGSAADMVISTISIIGTNTLRTNITTDSLHGKYEYHYLQQ